MQSFSECVLTLVATPGKAEPTTDLAMTELEYDVLDELYFVVSFSDLRNTVDLETDELKNVLQTLLRRGWIKCLSSRTDEISASELNFERRYQDYFYLATKAGLLSHHGR